MRKEFRTVLIILFASLYMAGCRNYIQTTPAITATAPIKPTATLQSTLTSLPFPTITLAPFIIPTSTPLSAKSIFEPFPMEFYRNTIKTDFGVISASSVIEENILVDNTLGDIHFTLAWKEGNLDMYLIQPDGVVIDSSVAEAEENISFISSSTNKEYYFSSPQTGAWRMVVTNTISLGTNYKTEVYSTACPMRVGVYFDNENGFPAIDSREGYHVVGDCIQLLARVEDIISLTSDRIYVHGAVIQMTVNDPRKDQYSFNLYDDGFHGDGDAGDGNYGNFFCNTKIPGEYFFHVQISGVTNWHGGYGVGKLPFTRESVRSIVVH